MITLLNPLIPLNSWPASRRYCGVFPVEQARGFTSLAPFAWIFEALKLCAKANLFIFLLGNFNSCVISLTTKESVCLVMNFYARCGVIRLALSHALLMYTLPVCA